MDLTKIIKSALQKPITVVVVILAIIFFAVVSIRKMPIDIFPKLGTPAIYVAQTYGGLSPEQIESYVTFYYEYHFLYVTGIQSVESKTVQGIALIKLNFYEGTDIGQAMGEVVAQVNRARAFMPPGTVSPFITRFDGGSVPVGQLVFESKTRSLAEIQEQALFKVRPMFSSLPGVSAPPPFGGNQRTIVIKADPDKLRSYQITPEELITSIAKSNTLTPAGNIRIEDQLLITPQNTVVEQYKELENIVVRNGNHSSIFVKDIANVENGADITSGYALVNGKRSVYIPVTKRADASTWNVVQNIKKALPDMQAAVPDDIQVRYVFDQSGYVINALSNLVNEGALGALLTGLMVLLFLRNWRSSLLVVLTIPLALLSSVICMYALGQSLNIMTLSGLALAVGILVDEATVTIENIHRYLEKGRPKRAAIWEACKEIALPKFLILLCILAVFVPALFMSGIPRAMFLPLSLAVGLAMIASFILSQTFVPVFANWMLSGHTVQHESKPSSFHRFQSGFTFFSGKLIEKGSILAILFILVTIGISYIGFKNIGKEIFPKINAGQMKVRLRMPDGTRLERTEESIKALLSIIDSIVGKNNVEISSGFLGVQASSYPVNVIHLWTSGQHEGVVSINLKKGVDIDVEALKEKIRNVIKTELPQARISFEPANLVDQVMSQGANNPIEIIVQSKDIGQSQKYAQKLLTSLQGYDYLRDVQIGIPLNAPSLKIDYDRIRLGQLGLTIDQVSKSVVAATSSSRFTQPVFWREPSSGNAFQIQVELPQYQMNTINALQNILVANVSGDNIYLRDIANITSTKQIGEYDRLNQNRFIPITANLHHKDLGASLDDLNKTIKGLGDLPTGMKIYLRGQSEIFKTTFNELGTGLLLAIVVILLLLAAYYQSFSISLVVLSSIPAVIAGSFILLLITGHTLNIQSYIGCIMAVGVSVANAILFISHAESYRKQGDLHASKKGMTDRLRPILMTAMAMIAGMLPMALGLGEGGEQVAPLGVAVIGGMLFSTVSLLLFLPIIYQKTIGKNEYKDVSLF